MSIATVKDGQLVLTGELLQQIGLKEGDSVAVEAMDAHTLRLRAATLEDADAQLLQLLDDPFDLGVVEPLDRAAIYDEAH